MKTKLHSLCNYFFTISFLFGTSLLFSQTQIGSDIDGQAVNDQFGHSTSISADGSIVAIGSRYNNGNGIDSGNVRVFQNVSGVWTQIGADIIGETAGDNSGFSISLSGDGNSVAIGAPNNNGNGSFSGHVRIYQNNSGVWTQIGSDIDGEAIDDSFGWNVSLSFDGNVVAIGAPFNDGNGSNSGHVRIYQNNSGVWTQIGSDINGEASGDQCGRSVSISSDGNSVAIGAPNNDGNGLDSGHVRMYQNISNVWTQVGSDINGEATGDTSGFSTSLSNDGNIVAIGAQNNDGNGSNSGHVRIYQNNSGVWTQIGSDIDGEAAGDNSGYSLSLSNDGSIVAIGATNNDGNGSNSGHVRIYQNVSDVWTQVSSDMNGEASSDVSGFSVSLSNNGNTVAIGATGNDGNGNDSGHVRVYDLSTILSNTTFEIEDSITMYPNPVSDVIKFDFNGYINGKIEMYSLDGKLVYTKDCKEINQLETSLSEFQNGVYIVHITNNDTTITRKIIKE